MKKLLLALALSIAYSTASIAQVVGPGPIVPTATGRATTGQIPGTTTNDSASAGNIGEFVSSTVLVGSAVSFTTATALNITSISLTAGDWNVWGYTETTPSISNTLWSGWTSTTSNTSPTSPNNGSYCIFRLTSTLQQSCPVGIQRLSLSGTTTVYLTGRCDFASGTCSGFGFIGARRVR